MKRCAIILCLLMASLSAMAQDNAKPLKKVVFMPQWVPQSQFAGYYMAKECGYYEEEGLDVEIRHIPVNSTQSVFEMLLSGEADIVSEYLTTGLRMRSMGIPVVNILQTSQNTSILSVTRNRLDSIGQLDGKKVARWKIGFGECFDFFVHKYGITPLSIPYSRDVNLFVYGAVDAILVTSYNEYVGLQVSMGKVDPACVIKMADYGFNYPEDGLFVSSQYLSRNKETVKKFVRASIRGWEYARSHRRETADFCYEFRVKNNLMGSRYATMKMLDQVLDLQINPRTGKADFEPVNIEDFYRLCNDMENTKKIKNSVKYPDFIKDLR